MINESRWYTSNKGAHGPGLEVRGVPHQGPAAPLVQEALDKREWAAGKAELWGGAEAAGDGQSCAQRGGRRGGESADAGHDGLGQNGCCGWSEVIWGLVVKNQIILMHPSILVT